MQLLKPSWNSVWDVVYANRFQLLRILEYHNHMFMYPVDGSHSGINLLVLCLPPFLPRPGPRFSVKALFYIQLSSSSLYSLRCQNYCRSPRRNKTRHPGHHKASLLCMTGVWETRVKVFVMWGIYERAYRTDVNVLSRMNNPYCEARIGQRGSEKLFASLGASDNPCGK